MLQVDAEPVTDVAKQAEETVKESDQAPKTEVDDEKKSQEVNALAEEKQEERAETEDDMEEIAPPITDEEAFGFLTKEEEEEAEDGDIEAVKVVSEYDWCAYSSMVSCVAISLSGKLAGEKWWHVR